MKEAELAVKHSRKPAKSMVAKHMVECGHKVSSEDLKVLKQVRKINQLDAYESWFISKQPVDTRLNSDLGNGYSPLFRKLLK